MNKLIFGSSAVLSAAALGILFAVATSGCTAAPGDGLPAAGEPEAGTLDLSSLRLSVDESTVTLGSDGSTRAVSRQDMDKFVVRITSLGPWYTGEVKVFTLAECRETVTLWAGDYSLSVSSPQAEMPAWETPLYSGGVERFTIGVRELTEITVPVVCRQNNVKLTVNYSDRLREAIVGTDGTGTGNVTVTVVGQEPAKPLVYPLTESRGGYFEVNGTGTTVLRVEFDGSIGGLRERHAKEIAVNPGEWARIYLSLDQDETFHIMVFGSKAGQIGNGTDWV